MNFELFTFQYQSESTIECRREKENGALEVRLLVKGDMAESAPVDGEPGEPIDLWEALHESGVDIAPRDPQMVEAETKAADKVQREKAKLVGVKINGQAVSLTEENQNGLAAVMQGANLAAEMGVDIFPLNFNAQTATGFELITFSAADEFKAFCLTFLSERQKFFK